MIRKCFIAWCILIISSSSVISAKEADNIYSILTTTVSTTILENENKASPIPNARVVVIDPTTGKIIGNALTNSKGLAKMAITTQIDPRFPSKEMGEVTIIAFANGYNEHIDFSVPINEYNDQTARTHISLRVIDPTRRNEPQFLNGSFHRFTVFEMLDYYAKKLGLNRQKVNDPSIDPAPWGSE